MTGAHLIMHFKFIFKRCQMQLGLPLGFEYHRFFGYLLPIKGKAKNILQNGLSVITYHQLGIKDLWHLKYGEFFGKSPVGGVE